MGPRRVLGFQTHYERVAQPFEWKFTRADLGRVLVHLDNTEHPTAVAA